MNQSFVKLLNAYRQLWSNRSLANDQYLDNESSKQLLLETIEKELRDEMTHPRVRQSPEVKFYIALKRIMLSSLSEREKLELIQLHLEVMNKISDY
ncbi:hypothetical protein [Bacillus alveayuensis]|uniref:hypothetical protein n=1 Tax=Aeribacillus alveayuensis TaxID=279215 RepID=UPI0005CD6EAE|nr:hypothetical protein [Bacillus alveayuensis]